MLDLSLNLCLNVAPALISSSKLESQVVWIELRGWKSYCVRTNRGHISWWFNNLFMFHDVYLRSMCAHWHISTRINPKHATREISYELIESYLVKYDITTFLWFFDKPIHLFLNIILSESFINWNLTFVF